MLMNNYFGYIVYCAWAELRADTARSFLGLAWWVFEPIMYLGAFYVVFGLIFQQREENYAAFLLAGLIFWRWFAASVSAASFSILKNMGLINEVYLPKLVFPLIAVLSSAMKFAVVLTLYFFYLYLTGLDHFIGSFGQVIILLFTQLLLIIAFSFFVASVVPFVPDMKFLIENGLMMMFFLSGVFFKLKDLPPDVQWWLNLNPMAVLIQAYRDVFIDNQGIDTWVIFDVFIFSIVFIFVGFFLIKALDKKYALKVSG